MSNQEGPALPWASTSNTARDPTVIHDLPATLGMQTGVARVEVLWSVAPDSDESGGEEEEESSRMWWGATLHRQADGAKDAEGRVGYILLYDPNPSVGFDAPTEQCVTFLDDHELFDFEYDDFLPWRREGEGWEPSEDPNSDVVLDESGRILHDVSKSNEIEAKYTRVRGKSGMDLFREECAATIATLPPEVQHITAERVTAGLQTFKEEVIAMVAAKDATGSTVIEVEDIQEIIQNMKSRLQKEGKL